MTVLRGQTRGDKGGSVRQTADTAATDTAILSDIPAADGRHSGGRVSDTMADTSDGLSTKAAGEIARLKAENDLLREQNARLYTLAEGAQTALSQALTRLSDEQQRTHTLEIQAGRLIEALPAPQDSPPDAPQGPQANETTAEAPEAGEAGNSVSEAKKQRRWWQAWRGKAQT